LITNHTGVDSTLHSVADLIDQDATLQLTALFGPEHGISGEAQAGDEIKSGPRVFSLYGEHRAPDETMLRDVDILVFDIQDVGSRFYTYISTMFESMKAAAQHGKPFIVLDRPNPIGGSRVEGPVLEEGQESFVGIFPIPIRHGMTTGELARFFNSEAELQTDLHVVPLLNWSRDDWASTKLQWIAPSPNMPTSRTTLLYPGFCLIEGVNLSEGRGTTRPFELVGSPWLDASELANRLNRLELPGVFFRPQDFIPMFSKYSGESCSGLQVHITDRENFSPITAALHLIREAIQLHPEELTFRESAFDRLIGNSWVREQLKSGSTVESIERRWAAGLDEFKLVREEYLLY
jgi:beta-N-acetylhexosaminidase